MSKVADVIGLALVHGEVEGGLPIRAVRVQAVAGDLEVDEAPVGVPARQALPLILLQLVLVVLALLEPEEAFGLGRHVVHDRLVGEVLVAVDDDLADGDPLAFLDVEHDPDLAVLLGQLQGLDLGGVVAGVLVERVDGGARLLDRVAVERAPLGQLDLALDRALAQAAPRPAPPSAPAPAAP